MKFLNHWMEKYYQKNLLKRFEEVKEIVNRKRKDFDSVDCHYSDGCRHCIEYWQDKAIN